MRSSNEYSSRLSEARRRPDRSSKRSSIRMDWPVSSWRSRGRLPRSVQRRMSLASPRSRRASRRARRPSGVSKVWKWRFLVRGAEGSSRRSTSRRTKASIGPAIGSESNNRIVALAPEPAPGEDFPNGVRPSRLRRSPRARRPARPPVPPARMPVELGRRKPCPLGRSFRRPARRRGPRGSAGSGPDPTLSRAAWW